MNKFFCVPFIVEGSRNDRKMDFGADVFSGRFKKSIGNVGSPLGGEIRRGSNCLQDLQRQKNKSFTFVVYTTPLCSRDRKLMYICDKTIIIFSTALQTDSNTVRRRIGFPFNAEAGNMADDWTVAKLEYMIERRS